MRSRKRSEITIETERTLIIRRARNPEMQWCATCQQNVAMVSAEEAALIARVSSRTIYRRVESGDLHFSETPDGLLRICPRSLPRARGAHSP